MQGYTDKLSILNKIHHLVFGIGYKCKVDSIDMNCTKNFFGSKYCTTSDWRPISITNKECWYMVEKKRCRIETIDFIFDKRMKCNEKLCSFYEYPKQKFNWLDTNYMHG